MQCCYLEVEKAFTNGKKGPLRIKTKESIFHHAAFFHLCHIRGDLRAEGGQANGFCTTDSPGQPIFPPTPFSSSLLRVRSLSGQEMRRFRK